MFFSATAPRIEVISVPNETLTICLRKVGCQTFLTTVLCRPWRLQCCKLYLHSCKTTAQTPMLLTLLAINPEETCCGHFFFCHKLFLAHMWECRRRNRMKHALSLHIGQVHVLVYYIYIYIIKYGST